jgi:hypothetical protein
VLGVGLGKLICESEAVHVGCLGLDTRKMDVVWNQVCDMIYNMLMLKALVPGE